MVVPATAKAMDNIFRLSSLKNANSKRRVTSEDALLDQMDDYENDFSGTSNNYEPIQKEPELDLGGELNSQAYDVRANEVIPEENPSYLQKFGNWFREGYTPSLHPEAQKRLTSLRNVNPREELSNEIIPENQIIENKPQENEGVLDYLGLRVKPHESVIPLTKYAENPPTDQPSSLTKLAHLLGVSPSEEVIEKHPEIKESELYKYDQKLQKEALDKAQENPMEIVAYGATDEFANSPELKSEYFTYTGQDLSDEEIELTKNYEKVLSDLQEGYLDQETSYNEQEKRILNRILNNETTDLDKYYVGLALLMPLIVGGFFGKEAALGALAGTTQGIGEIFKNRQENIRKDEESLSDIYKQRSAIGIKKGELELEKLKVPQQVKKQLPEDDYKDLKNMNIYTFKDPKTDKIIGTGAEILPDLYMNLQYANTEKKRDEITKEGRELGKEKASLEKANKATSNIVNAASQLKNKSMFSKIFSLAMLGNEKAKAIMKADSPEIMVDGRKQNAYVYIDSQLSLLTDAYRRTEGMKALTNTVQEHFSDIVKNPAYSGLDPKDLIDQILTVRGRAQTGFVDKAHSLGFLREPLENKFGKMNKGIYESLNEKEKRNLAQKEKEEIIKG